MQSSGMPSWWLCFIMFSSEPLAIEYVWGEDVDTPNTFHFYEKYEGRGGFEAHTQAPHFEAWEAFAATAPFLAPFGSFPPATPSAAP